MPVVRTVFERELFQFRESLFRNLYVHVRLFLLPMNIQISICCRLAGLLARRYLVIVRDYPEHT